MIGDEMFLNFMVLTNPNFKLNNMDKFIDLRYKIFNPDDLFANS